MATAMLPVSIAYLAVGLDQGGYIRIALLPLLKNRLTLSIPEPTYLGTPSNAFQRRFYGHELIKGQSGCSVELSAKDYDKAAAALGAFLKGLHTLDIKELNISEADVGPSFSRTNFSKAFKAQEKKAQLEEKQKRIAENDAVLMALVIPASQLKSPR